MGKQIKFKKDARLSILKGMDILAEAVTATMGAKGRNVVIDNQHMIAPVVTKDGVSVAKKVESSDCYENLGIKMIREAASKTNDLAGDGTTTSTLLAHQIVKHGLKNVEMGISPISLKNGLEKGLDHVVKKLDEISEKIDIKDIKKVASISANDEKIGDIIASMIENVGEDGIILVQNGESIETKEEYLKGMEIDQGYVSPYMVTDPEKREAFFQDTHVLLTDYKLETFTHLLPFLQNLTENNINKLVIVCEEASLDVIQNFLNNQIQGRFSCLIIKNPGIGDMKKDYLDDLSVVLGGKVISKEKGQKLDEITIDDLGFAKKITSTKNKTIFVDGRGEKKDIDKYAEGVKLSLQEAKLEYEKEKIKERLARLLGAIGIINVGGSTEMEIKEKRDRIEDALSASRAALEEGIVPGGGVALLNLKESLYELELENDEQFGLDILMKVLEEPIKKIVENAGFNGDVVIDNIRQKKTNSYGFNVLTKQYEDMIENGIIDPTKVVRVALQNAVSAAIMVLTTDVVITDEYKEN